jgi:hypothetical protein
MRKNGRKIGNISALIDIHCESCVELRIELQAERQSIEAALLGPLTM